MTVRNSLLIGSLVLAYLAGVFEIYYQFSGRYPGADAEFVYLQTYTFAVAILLLNVFRRITAIALLKFLFTALCLGIYLVHINDNYSISLDLFLGNKGALFTGHWIAAILLLWLLADLAKFFFRIKEGEWVSYKPAFTWVASISIIVLLSVEMRHVILWVFMDLKEEAWWDNLYFKPALTILWSIGSFIMIWLGMKYRFQTLRIISLTLFMVTLIKLFTYDIVKIAPGGKIAAFILLGILLLTVSFMYQRLKKILIDDKTVE